VVELRCQEQRYNIWGCPKRRPNTSFSKRSTPSVSRTAPGCVKQQRQWQGPDPALLAASGVPLLHPCFSQTLGWLYVFFPSPRAGEARGGAAALWLGLEQAPCKPLIHRVLLAGKNR